MTERSVVERMVEFHNALVAAGCCRPSAGHDVHIVRVYRNEGPGADWWAEDDRGLVAGADTYDELAKRVWEYVEAEGLGCMAMVEYSVPPDHFVDLSGTVRSTTAVGVGWAPCPEDFAMCNRLAGGFWWLSDVELGLVRWLHGDAVSGS